MQRIGFNIYKKFIILGIITTLTIVQLLYGYYHNILANKHENMKDALRNENTKLVDIEKSLENAIGFSSEIHVPSNNNMTYSVTQKIFLISSNPRTGSSYVANIIAAIPNSSYYYEPLRVTSNLNNNNQSYKFISRLFDCEYESIKGNISTTEVRSFLFKKPQMAPNERILLYPYRKLKTFFHLKEKECQQTKFRLVKTYQLPIFNLLKEMQSNSSAFGPNFKVIYLARDPRGSINSLLQSPEINSNRKFANVNYTCKRLYSDIKAVEENSKTKQFKNRIKVLRYEDVIEHPKHLAYIIYSFLGATNLLSHALQFIDDHQLNAKELQHYYSDLKTGKHLISSQSDMKTFYSKAFGPNSWKNELPQKYLQQIKDESACIYSMKLLGYL